MKTISTLSPEALQKLNLVMVMSPEPITFQARVLEALSISQVYADQLDNPAHRQNMLNKLAKSNVAGSVVMGVSALDDVVAMLAGVTHWEEIPTTLTDTDITVVQGKLPASYKALAAYASVREIGRIYGQDGLDTIKYKKGYQGDDKYYACTMIKFETDMITVHLKKGPNETEYMVHWFAGRELQSRVREDEGDNVVRCGTVVKPTAQLRPRYIQGAERNVSGHGRGY